MRRKLEISNAELQKRSTEINTRYRHTYHAQVPAAWGNDPNGFGWYKGKAQLFYQCNPYSSKWDTMHWGHLTSEDFVKWQVEPIALAPDQDYDDELGCFSGTSFVEGDKLYVMYTGVSDKQEQCLAWSEDGIHFEKYDGNPVIRVDMLPEEVSHVDFRDPKVFKKNNTYYCLLGTKTYDHGNIVLFRGKSLAEWEYVGMLFETEEEQADNYFCIQGPCECPDYQVIDGKECLFFCPQLLKRQGMHYENIHSTVVMPGHLDFETGKFVFETIQELDEGFDFYASETLQMEDGRTILIAWKQMWDRTFVTAEDGYVGSFTLPREISMKEGHLYQTPVKEIQKYGKKAFEGTTISLTNAVNNFIDGVKGRNIRLSIDADLTQAASFAVSVFAGEKEETKLLYDKNTGVFSLDRRNSGIEIQGVEENLYTRSCMTPLLDGHLKLDIFLDVSSVEVFLQDGYQVMTANVYPGKESDMVLFSTEGTATMDVNCWEIH